MSTTIHNSTSAHSLPVLIVMGVCASGKSTLAKRVAEQTGWSFFEADDFHSAQNKQKMASGIPLTDEDRAPWIQAMCDTIVAHEQPIVLAYSGLRAAHRAHFHALPRRVRFVYLDVPQEEIVRRIKSRTDHFMPASLVESQFEALQIVAGEEHFVSLPSSPDIEHLCQQIMAEVIAPMR